MNTISRRSVYQHILNQPDSKVVVSGTKIFVHTRIAQDMGSYDQERAVRAILVELIREGLLQASRNKRMVWIESPIDPTVLEDELSPRGPETVEPPVLNGRPYVPHRDQMPVLPCTGESAIAQAAGEPPDPALPESPPEPAKEMTDGGKVSAPSPAGLATFVTNPVQIAPAREPAIRTSSPQRRQPVTRRNQELTPSAKMIAENRRLTADNERLKRERDSANRKAAEADARLEAMRVPPATQLIWYLLQMIMAMKYQIAAEIHRAETEVAAARQALREAEGMIRTLEKRPATDQSDLVKRLEGRVRALDDQVARLKTENTRVNKAASELRRKVAQLERDADQDGEELSNMIESLESAERLLNHFRGDRLLERRPLIGCGHMVIMMVDQEHNPKTGRSGCHELELTEIVR